ncbi:MAG: serine hydrolase [Planctomycetota bacterium]
MNRLKLFVALLVAYWGGAPATALFGQPCDFSGVTQVAQGLIDNGFLVNGASVWLETGDLAVSEVHYLGTYDASTVVPIASATKLLSAVAILSLVDDGLLDLDAPVATYLPLWNGARGTMTVRQMFSHTSGLPGGSQHPVLGDDTLNLAQAVEQIRTTTPLDAAPGTQFAYGGLSMHVAGRVAEVVTGQSWAQLFAARVATPLGLTATDYYGFGFTLNPRIAGGARSSLTDYGKVLRMLARDGWHEGVQVLSSAAIQTMTSDQTNGVPIVSSPAPAGVRYGIGVWLNLVAADGTTIRVSSPGAFGFTPWIDLDLRFSGILMIQYLQTLVQSDAEMMQSLARAEVQACLPFFRRGDVNADQSLDIGDPIALLNFVFPTVPPSIPLACADSLDANDDGAIDISDAVTLLQHLFGANSQPLPFPGGDCSIDGTPDALTCSVSVCP